MKIKVGDLSYLLDFSEQIELVFDDMVIGPMPLHELGFVGYEIIGIHAAKKGLLVLRVKDPREEKKSK